MFRIAFSTTTGNWQIQFLLLGLFWVSVKNQNQDGPIEFENLAAARDYVMKKGIHEAYEEHFSFGKSRPAYESMPR